jgi:hypothetical protein
MILKFILTATLILIFSNNASAMHGRPDTDKKNFYTLQALVENQDISIYLKNINESKGNPRIISIQDFTDLLTTQFTYQRMLKLRPEPDVVTKFRSFVKANALNPSMVGYSNLQAGQNILLNIMFLVDLQKRVSERQDLHFFGEGTIRNLNIAISGRVSALYNLAERYLGVSKFSQKISENIKTNFVKEGLKYENILSPSEQWINEYMGLDKNYVKEQEPKEILRILTNLFTANTNLNLKTSPASLCSSLFF